VAVPMGWRGLLRVVDFQALLSAQPVVAAALDKAQRASGTLAPEVKTLREGYRLLAKVLWTRRASIQRVHDLAWLDHTVVSVGTRLGRTWTGEDGVRAIDAAERTTTAPVFLELFPREGSIWIEIPVQAFAGISPNVKFELGISGPVRVGIVPNGKLKALYDATGTAKFDAPPTAVSVLGELEALAAAARRASSPSVALVFAASSFEERAAE